MTIESISAPVLIVGAGPAGLTTALSLARHRTQSIVLEQRAEISKHPRAIGFTSTTLEVFRSFGITEEEIPSAPEGFRLVRRRVQSLEGKHYEDTEWAKPRRGGPRQAQGAPCSYVRAAASSQDKVEQALINHAQEAGVDIRMNHHVKEVSQDAQGVRATVVNQVTGETILFTARYLVAADGHRSPIRKQLCIGRQGRGHIRTIRSVLFRSKTMDKYLATGAHQFSFEEPDFEAFMTTYGDSRWVLMFTDDKERTLEELDAAIVRAVGSSDFEREIITTGRWQLGALIANTFQRGRIFLAGDAAHQLPPNRGGYGANTGVADGFNLAWKLAAVVQGKADAHLLETYDAERRPIAWLRILQLFARPDYQRDADGFAQDEEIIGDDAMEFGQRLLGIEEVRQYDGPGMKKTEARHPDEWKAAVGTRLPHVLVRDLASSSATISSLQLGHKEGLAHAWKVISKSPLKADEKSAIEAVQVPVYFATLGENLFDADEQSTGAVASATNLSDSESIILVRPDAHVAWRGASSADQGLLQALARK